MSITIGGRKKGLRLLPKILLTVVIPLGVMVIISSMILNIACTKLTNQLAEQEMKTAVYAMQCSLEMLGNARYYVVDNNLYRGEYNLSQNSHLLDDFKAVTGVDATFLWKNERLVTTLKDDSDTTILHSNISDEIYKIVKEEGEYFSDDLMINGKKYYGYYEKLGTYGPDEELIMFCGKEATAVSSIYAGLLASNTSAMLILGVIICILIIINVRMVIRAMNKAIGYLNEVAQGKLNIEDTEKLCERADEIGDIAQAIKLLIEKFNQVIKSLSSCTKTLSEFSGYFEERFLSIGAAIKNINIAVEEIAVGATNQANETQDVTEQMGKMGYSVQGTSTSVTHLLQNTDEMKHHNEAVHNIMEELMRLNTKTSDAMSNVKEQTDSTNTSVIEIRNVVDLISNIAKQTNLLALNASIEAARAGEQGRGFAVVAEEIRQLADQSQSAAQNIGNIIEALISQSNESVTIIGDVSQQMSYESHKLIETVDLFEKLNQNIHRVSKEINVISDEIGTIEQAKDIVITNLEGLAAISEENAAGTQETSATMGEVSHIVTECNQYVIQLVELASLLNGEIEKFKL